MSYTNNHALRGRPRLARSVLAGTIAALAFAGASATHAPQASAIPGQDSGSDVTDVTFAIFCWGPTPPRRSIHWPECSSAPAPP